jgi:hypothetical protein
VNHSISGWTALFLLVVASSASAAIPVPRIFRDWTTSIAGWKVGVVEQERFAPRKVTVEPVVTVGREIEIVAGPSRFALPGTIWAYATAALAITSLVLWTSGQAFSVFKS